MKNSNRKNNTAMRVAAGAMSVLTVAAYTVPANVGGFLTGSSTLVANAEEGFGTPDRENPLVTAPEAVEDLAYTGEALTLISEGATTGGTLVYAVTTDDQLPDDNEWSESLPTGTDIGSYTVWYKVEGDDDFYGTSPQSFSVSIDKAVAEITAPELNNAYYTGRDIQVIKTAGSAKGVQTGIDENLEPVFEDVALEYALIDADELDQELKFFEKLEWTSDIQSIKVKDEGSYGLFWRVADEKYKVGFIEEGIFIETYANGGVPFELAVKNSNIILSNLDTSSKPAVLVNSDGNVLEPGDTGYEITGGTYYIYTDKTIANTTLRNGTKLFRELSVSQSTDQTFDDVSYNYCYTLIIPESPENGYLITHTNSFTGKVPDGEEDTLYVTEDAGLKGELAAVLKSAGIYYYGDTPDKDECVEITPGFENIVESLDAYFTNEEGNKISNDALQYGTQYYLTAKVAVDVDGEPGGARNILYIRRPIEYKPRPLYLCDFYLDAADAEGEFDGELNILSNEPTEGIVYDTKLTVEEFDNEGEKYYNIDIDDGTFVYNEEEQAPKIFIVNKANGEVLGTVTAAEFAEMTDEEKAAVSCIDGVEAKTAQGEYSFAIVANDNSNYTDDVIINWSIARKPLLGINVVPKEGIIYNGEVLDIDDFVFSGSDVDILEDEGTDCSVSFTKEIDGVTVGTDGKSAGDHIAYITITTENFAPRIINVPVTIGKRPVTVTPVQEDYVYGTEEAPELTYDVNMAVAGEDGKYADSGEDAKGFIDGEEIDFSQSFKIKDFDTTTFKNNAGNYEYNASIEGTPGQLDPAYNYDNYDITIDPEAAFTVSKKPLTQDMFLTDSPTSYTYTGEEINAPTYYISEDEAWSDETTKLRWSDIIPGGTQTAILPGNFSVEAVASENGNYSGFVSYKWSVIGDTSYSTSVGVDSKTYDGKAIDTPEIFYFYDGNIAENAPKNAKVTYTYYKVDVYPEDINDDTVAGLEGTTVAPKDAGKYIVKASVKAKGYTIADSYNVFVINQKEIKITPSITGKQYGEADPEFTFNDLSDIIAEGDDVNFTGSYAIGNKLTYGSGDSVPYDGSVGIYDFTLGDLEIDSDNYILSIDEEALFTVTTRDITDDDIFVIAPAYTGEDGWATINGGEDGNYVVKVVLNGVETVLEENVDYTVINAPKTMNVGDYYIQIKGINNFSNVAEAAVEVRADSVVLTPGAPTVTINPANNQLYVYVSYTATTKNGFEILEHNIIFCNDGSVKDASELKIDKVNDENIKIVSGRRGTNLRDFGKDVVAVGCAKVKNPEGEISYIYTDNIGYKGVTIGETTPTAVLNPANNNEYVHVYFSCTVNSDDYTVEDRGIFYCNNGAVSAEELEAMTVEEAEANADVTVIPSKSGTNIRDYGKGVVAVGYEVVKNTSDQIGYIYTKNIGGSYADLS